MSLHAHSGSCNARLHRLYVSATLLGQAFVYNVLSVSFSNHCLVQVRLNFSVRRRLLPNWALWKCNVSLLLDAGLCERVFSCLRDPTADATTAVLIQWDLFKQEVLRASTRNANMRALSPSLYHLYELECDRPG